MAELTQATEAVAEVADQVAAHAEQVAKVSRALSHRELGLMITGIAGGIICGFSTGYFIAKKRLEKKNKVYLEEERAAMQKYYMKKDAEVPFDPEAERMIGLQEAKPTDEQREEWAQARTRNIRDKKDLAQLVKEQGYQDDTDLHVVTGPIPTEPIRRKIVATPLPDADELIKKTREEAAIKRVNIWDAETPEDVWDYTEEMRVRDANSPYVIHKDEFDQNENDWEHDTLTYYEGDDVLADGKDDALDQDDIVGVENLGKFGHGSQDPNIVYIRNERLQLDMEVVHSDGSYAEEVHGYVEHSDTQPRRRGRRHHDTE